jgi:hypothetical protein
MTDMRDKIADILRGGQLQHIEEDVMADAILAAMPDIFQALIEQKDERIEELEAALEWYAAHVPDCRKLGRDGDEARGKLDRDGGTKAREALTGEQT